MNWLNALGSVSQDRVFAVRNGVWGHEGDALEIGVWWEEKLERWKRRFINMKLHIQWNITFIYSFQVLWLKFVLR